MKRECAILLLASACVSGSVETGREPSDPMDPATPVEGADPFMVNAADVENITFRQNVLNRRAIFEGNNLASEVFEDAMNQILTSVGAAAMRFEDQPMTPGTDRAMTIVLPDGMEPEAVDPMAPAGVDPAAACPFAVAPAALDPSVSCRRLGAMALDNARTRSVGAVAEAGLTDEFLEDAPEQEQVIGWYEDAVDFGVDVAPDYAVEALRRAGVCDRTPTQEDSAFERGHAVGHGAAVTAIRQQESVTPRTQCNTDTAIVNPGRAEAMGSVPELVSANVLCDGFVGTVDEERRLGVARTEFEAGILAGIDAAAREESARLVRVWVCEPPDDGGRDGGGGDPLVLDLDDNGIHIEPIAVGASFNFGNGDGEVRTQWLFGDAFVVFDRDGDGEIVSTELFGDVTVTEDGETARDGMEALGLYDAAERGGNEDGRIDSADAVYSELELWMDNDGDARVDGGELVTLEEAGVSAIDFTNERYFTGSEEHLAADVWFEYR